MTYELAKWLGEFARYILEQDQLEHDYDRTRMLEQFAHELAGIIKRGTGEGVG